MFDHPDYDGHEKVLMVEDDASGLKAIIAIHSTALGAAAGGCRLWTYDTAAAALSDALKLSRGMSYKNAMAGLAMGGGKAVILGPVPTEKREAVMLAFGRAVESLNGEYLTAEDVGVSVDDMMIVARTTKHVGGLAASAGKTGGDPSPFTARGVRIGMEAAVRAKLGRAELAGLTVAVQGLGHVGMYLCEELFTLGANLVVTDINPARISEAQRRFGAAGVGIDDILTQDADVVAPCALGGTISEYAARYMKASIVAGAANNQLQTPEAGRLLHERGILYAPDYVINAGGIIAVAGEWAGRGVDAISAQIEAIGPRLDAIFAEAAHDNVLPEVVADSQARAKIATASSSLRSGEGGSLPKAMLGGAFAGAATGI